MCITGEKKKPMTMRKTFQSSVLLGDAIFSYIVLRVVCVEFIDYNVRFSYYLIRLCFTNFIMVNRLLASIINQ